MTSRLPGRGLSFDLVNVTALLREAETRHGDYESGSPKHHWSDWYAGYIVARGNGATPDEASARGAQNVERAREVVPA